MTEQGKQLSFYSVICTKGRPELLKKTLESLERCVKPDAYKGVLLVENGPQRKVEELIAARTWKIPIRYYHLPISNRGIAYNLLLKEFNDCIFYFHDDDIRVSGNILVRLWEHVVSEKKRCFFGGPLDVEYERKPENWLRKFLPFSAKGWRLKSDGVVRGVFSGFLGGNWAAHVNDLRDAGGFSQWIGPGRRIAGQETLIQKKMILNGISPFYVSDMLVWHYVPIRRCSRKWVLLRARRTAMGIGNNDRRWGIRFWRFLFSTFMTVLFYPSRLIPMRVAYENKIVFALKFLFIWHSSVLNGLLRKDRS